MRRAAIGLALITLAGCASSPALHLAPCTVADAPARCGTFEVAESPTSSRVLPLKVIVLPATERNVAPIFVFGGGPGVPVTPGAELEVKLFAAERRFHDTVFVDERGAGGSAPLVCPNAMKAHEREMIEGDLFPASLVIDCRRELEPKADLTHYTFDDFTADVESLRKALGYERIDIIALSAGTRAALTFLSHFPSSVRSMLLTGPVPPENRIPLEFARDADAAMQILIRDSASAFPSFESELASVRAWLGTHPMDISSAGYTIHMTRGAFDEFLRTTMYTADRQALVPLIVHLAATGEWQRIAPRFINYRRNFYDGLGIFLSVTCPTDVRYIKPGEIHDDRVSRQVTACELWAPGLAPRVTVARTNVPVLIFSGAIDPVTPPRWADVLARDLGNARIVTLANTGHTEFNPCTDSIEVPFFDAGSFALLDDSCAKSLQRPPFATTLP
jgi:pimeloyl-ACP methyl ester carboxylesterase